MAIVRTTPKETTTGAPPAETNGSAVGGTVASGAGQTRSVVNQPARAQASAAPARPAPGRPGVPVKTGTPAAPSVFVNETMTELRRVVWPSRQEVQAGTIVTIGLLLFFSLYIFGLDVIANWLFHTLGLYTPADPIR